MVEARFVRRAWDATDLDGPPELRWIIAPYGQDIAVLLGAFDPPTEAHVALTNAAARARHALPVIGFTKTLLARPGEALFTPVRRLELLADICHREGFGLFVANRPTYLDVARVLRDTGHSPTFVVGTDKLEQLADPGFYPDGEDGVRATFDEVDLLVVPRSGSSLDRDLPVLHNAFNHTDLAQVSGTEVRRRARAGEAVDHLVPPEVVLALRGYTSE